MCTRVHRHSIFCILPPHILRAIATNSAQQPEREAALRTLSLDSTFRSLRLAGGIPTGRPHIARLGAEEGSKQRTIYSANGHQDLPGEIMRKEGSTPSSDVATNEAYDGLGSTYDFYWENFARHSIDDEGMPLNATIHYGSKYNNAFWNGEQMVFGDGDGAIFERFTKCLDVIGHELTHGVTQDEAGLIYQFQPGALNESVSDVFGSLIKQFQLKQTADKADWLIGAGLFTSRIQGKALRSMAAPGTAYDDPTLGKDPQPAHMRNLVRTFEDNGGVHINSGIPNHAFYLAATKLGGYAWEKAGRIWYETLKDARLRPNAGFSRFAKLTVSVAGRLYGATSSEAKAVGDAWKEVGVRT